MDSGIIEQATDIIIQAYVYSIVAISVFAILELHFLLAIKKFSKVRKHGILKKLLVHRMISRLTDDSFSASSFREYAGNLAVLFCLFGGLVFWLVIILNYTVEISFIAVVLTLCVFLLRFVWWLRRKQIQKNDVYAKLSGEDDKYK